MTCLEHDSWSRKEPRPSGDALSRARFWQWIKPYEVSFWEVVDTLLAHYPACRFKRDEQITLGDFAGGVA